MSELLHGTSVLIVDDDASSRAVLRIALEYYGCIVSEAESGPAALEQMEAVELVLLDAVLPGGPDGLEVCRRIQQRANPPAVLMLTGYDDVTSIDAAFAAGAVDYVSKPIQLPLLIYRLRSLLKMHRAVTSLARCESTLGSVTENMLDMVWQTDRDYTLRYVTPSTLGTLGYSAEQLVGRPFDEHIHLDDRDMVRNVLNAGKLLECRYQHAAGHLVWLETRIKPLPDGHVLALRDITTRKRLESR